MTSNFHIYVGLILLHTQEVCFPDLVDRRGGGEEVHSHAGRRQSVNLSACVHRYLTLWQAADDVVPTKQVLVERHEQGTKRMDRQVSSCTSRWMDHG
jgi:hypothetical protein